MMGSSPGGLLGCESRAGLGGLLPASCPPSLYRQQPCPGSCWEMGSSYIKAMSLCQALSRRSVYTVVSEGCLGVLLVGCLPSCQLGWPPQHAEAQPGTYLRLRLSGWPGSGPGPPASPWYSPLPSPVASAPDFWLTLTPFLPSHHVACMDSWDYST